MVPAFRMKADLQHGALIGPEDRLPVTVETASACWAYAATFALRSDGGTDSPFGIRVTARVERGRIGIGCLNRSESAFVDEALVDAGPGQITVELLADAPAAMGPLVVRNASVDGTSRATIIDVACLPTGDEEIWTESLISPRAIPAWGQAYGSHGTTLAERARLRRFGRLDAPALMRWPDGLLFELVPGDQLSRVVYLSGTYEPNTLRLLRAWLRPGSVFVDVGANAGVITLAAATWVGATGRVIAIEPSSREFARLERHVRLNALANVSAVRAAVAAAAGPRTLRVATAAAAGGNTLGARFAYPTIEAAGEEMVDAVALDELATRLRLDRVDVIKLDIEGSEVEALLGAADLLERHRPTLVVEVCATALEGSGATVAALEAALRAAGYATFEIDDQTGELLPVSALTTAGGRNVVALPIEDVDARLRAAAQTSPPTDAQRHRRRLSNR
jgi:FkbM family methyltransferase